MIIACEKQEDLNMRNNNNNKIEYVFEKIKKEINSYPNHQRSLSCPTLTNENKYNKTQITNNNININNLLNHHHQHTQQDCSYEEEEDVRSDLSQKEKKFIVDSETQSNPPLLAQSKHNTNNNSAYNLITAAHKHLQRCNASTSSFGKNYLLKSDYCKTSVSNCYNNRYNNDDNCNPFTYYGVDKKKNAAYDCFLFVKKPIKRESEPDYGDFITKNGDGFLNKSKKKPMINTNNDEDESMFNGQNDDGDVYEENIEEGDMFDSYYNNNDIYSRISIIMNTTEQFKNRNSNEDMMSNRSSTNVNNNNNNNNNNYTTISGINCGSQRNSNSNVNNSGIQGSGGNGNNNNASGHIRRNSNSNGQFISGSSGNDNCKNNNTSNISNNGNLISTNTSSTINMFGNMLSNNNNNSNNTNNENQTTLQANVTSSSNISTNINNATKLSDNNNNTNSNSNNNNNNILNTNLPKQQPQPQQLPITPNIFSYNTNPYFISNPSLTHEQPPVYPQPTNLLQPLPFQTPLYFSSTKPPFGVPPPQFSALLQNQLNQNLIFTHQPFANYSDASLAQISPFLIKEQTGCRYIQEKVQASPQFANTLLFPFIIKSPSLSDLICDQFGNYLFQVLIDVLTEENLSIFIANISGNIYNICISPHGTRVLQKLIDKVASMPYQLKQVVFSLMNSKVIDIMKDPYGNHIIQKFLSRVHNEEDNSFVYDTVINNFMNIVNSKHGVCVVQKCVSEGNDEYKQQIYILLSKHIHEIITDQFGNYVIQYLLTSHEIKINEVECFLDYIMNNIFTLCKQKFSANVIEKCFENSNDEIKERIVMSMIKEKNYIIELLMDPFGNYVVQKALLVIKGELYTKMLIIISEGVNELKQAVFGNKLIVKLINTHKELGNLLANNENHCNTYCNKQKHYSGYNGGYGGNKRGNHWKK